MLHGQFGDLPFSHFDKWDSMGTFLTSWIMIGTFPIFVCAHSCVEVSRVPTVSMLISVLLYRGLHDVDRTMNSRTFTTLIISINQFFYFFFSICQEFSLKAILVKYKPNYLQDNRNWIWSNFTLKTFSRNIYIFLMFTNVILRVCYRNSQNVTVHFKN